MLLWWRDRRPAIIISSMGSMVSVSTATSFFALVGLITDRAKSASWNTDEKKVTKAVISQGARKRPESRALFLPGGVLVTYRLRLDVSCTYVSLQHSHHSSPVSIRLAKSPERVSREGNGVTTWKTPLDSDLKYDNNMFVPIFLHIRKRDQRYHHEEVHVKDRTGRIIF